MPHPSTGLTFFIDTRKSQSQVRRLIGFEVIPTEATFVTDNTRTDQQRPNSRDLSLLLERHSTRRYCGHHGVLVMVEWSRCTKRVQIDSENVRSVEVGTRFFFRQEIWDECVVGSGDRGRFYRIYKRRPLPYDDTFSQIHKAQKTIVLKQTRALGIQ